MGQWLTKRQNICQPHGFSGIILSLFAWKATNKTITMARKDKSPAPQKQSTSNTSPPPDQPIEGRLHGSGTEMEEIYDGKHDISNVDRQEGNMNHGTKGGCFDEAEDDGFIPAY
jgi:hypothetical protein